MEYIRLGQSGLKVSRLCLGTMNMGTPRLEAVDLQRGAKRADRASRARSRRELHRPRRFLFDRCR